MSGLDFRLLRLRFSFRAREPIHFPEGKTGNLLRGGFGAALRATGGEAFYRQWFDPSRATGPSGLASPPRPFVIRARQLDGRTVGAGEAFDLEMNLFDLRDAEAPAKIEAALAEFVRGGAGPGRGRAELIAAAGEPISLSLGPAPGPVRHAVVRFLSPTELKGAERPEFLVLAGRIRDRVSTLRSLYAGGPLSVDFRAFGERAASVRMTRCDISQVAASRRSSRTGQTHPLGGFVGEVEYDGELAEFLPYLEAARWTGVGRQTAWGKGEIDVTPLYRSKSG